MLFDGTITVSYAFHSTTRTNSVYQELASMARYLSPLHSHSLYLPHSLPYPHHNVVVSFHFLHRKPRILSGRTPSAAGQLNSVATFLQRITLLRRIRGMSCGHRGLLKLRALHTHFWTIRLLGSNNLSHVHYNAMRHIRSCSN